MRLPDEVDPVGGQGRDAAVTGKGVAPGHVIARGHLHEEVLQGIPFEGLEDPEIIGKNNEPLAPLPESPDQVEVLTTVAVREDPAEIGISLAIPDQQLYQHQ